MSGTRWLVHDGLSIGRQSVSRHFYFLAEDQRRVTTFTDPAAIQSTRRASQATRKMYEGGGGGGIGIDGSGWKRWVKEGGRI